MAPDKVVAPPALSDVTDWVHAQPPPQGIFLGRCCSAPPSLLLPAALIPVPCCTKVFMLKPGSSLRSTFLAQFLLLLHRKALTLLKYIEDDT